MFLFPDSVWFLTSIGLDESVLGKEVVVPVTRAGVGGMSSGERWFPLLAAFIAGLVDKSVCVSVIQYSTSG